MYLRETGNSEEDDSGKARDFSILIVAEVFLTMRLLMERNEEIPDHL